MAHALARNVVCAVVLTAATACGTQSRALVTSHGFGVQKTPIRVDSELTRRFLSTPAGDPGIDAICAKYDAMELNRANLGALSRETSPDFATIYFARRVLADPKNRELAARVDAELAALRAGQRGLVKEPHGKLLILMVPGYLYRTDPSTGADLQREMTLLKNAGYATEQVATVDDGTVEENGRIVAERLRKARADGQRIAIVSSSKGGPETAHALGVVLSPAETTHVAAWISVAGLMRGTPVADDLSTGPTGLVVSAVMWTQRLDPDSLRSITTTRSTARLARTRIPDHIFLLQYIAVPLSGQITNEARDRYRRLSNDGPNDGISLLADEMIGGVTVLELGVDHYFRAEGQALRTLAIARVMHAIADERSPAAATTAAAARLEDERAPR